LRPISPSCRGWCVNQREMPNFFSMSAIIGFVKPALRKSAKSSEMTCSHSSSTSEIGFPLWARYSAFASSSCPMNMSACARLVSIERLSGKRVWARLATVSAFANSFANRAYHTTSLSSVAARLPGLPSRFVSSASSLAARVSSRRSASSYRPVVVAYRLGNCSRAFLALALPLAAAFSYHSRALP